MLFFPTGVRTIQRVADQVALVRTGIRVLPTRVYGLLRRGNTRLGRFHLAGRLGATTVVRSARTTMVTAAVVVPSGPVPRYSGPTPIKLVVVIRVTVGRCVTTHPAENYIGQAPFIVGTACSACPVHPYCNNGLCSGIDISSCKLNCISDISETRCCQL